MLYPQMMQPVQPVPPMQMVPQMPMAPPMPMMSPMPIMYEPKELRALVISDSHVHGGKLNELAEWMKEIEPSYDVVLLLGNMCNMVDKLRNDYYAESEAVRQLDDTIAFLNDYIQKPIFYIPGNTEPSACYNSMLELPNGLNIHKRAVQLDEGLVIIGLGGSIPVKKEKKDVLSGFPYKTEDEFKNDLKACIESAKTTFDPNTSFVLLTHMGPAESGTAEVYLGTDKVNGGYKGLADITKDFNIICNIHGHSAVSGGLEKPFGASLPIVNPGGLVAGHFAEVSFRRGFDGKWKLGDVQLKSF